MDNNISNILITGIGVVGTLSGVILGAWINPKMQEKQRQNEIKKFLQNIDNLEKFIIYLAYNTTYIPIYKMGIDEHKSKDLDNREMHIVNELNNSINLLDLTIRKLEQEQRIFVRMDGFGGYIISLYTNLSIFIKQDKDLQQSLNDNAKNIISETIYPLYEKIIRENKIFKVINTFDADSILFNICIFMNNIKVLSIYGRNLSYLRPDTQEAFLNLPKGELHPNNI